jgi:hypothetical protein
MTDELQTLILELLPRTREGLFVIFGEQGMGLLPTTLGLGSNWTRWRLLRHLLPLYPAPAARRLSQFPPRITKSVMQTGSTPHRMKMVR